jgi:hypothetical protein
VMPISMTSDYVAIKPEPTIMIFSNHLACAPLQRPNPTGRSCAQEKFRLFPVAPYA